MKIYSKIILIALCSLISNASLAFGVGAGTIINSSGDADITTPDCFSCESGSATTEQSGFFLVLDTAIAKDKLFNYRLEIGKGEFEYSGGAKYDDFFIVNDFGFSFVRTSMVRVWAGPQLHISFQSPQSNTEVGDGVGVALGLAIGANIHVAKSLSIFVKLSRGLSGNYIYETDSFYDEEVDHDYTNINAGILFRFGS